MSIAFHCPNCSHGLQVSDDAAGKPVRCPKCRFKFVVPQHSQLAPPRPVVLSPTENTQPTASSTNTPTQTPSSKPSVTVSEVPPFTPSGKLLNFGCMLFVFGILLSGCTGLAWLSPAPKPLVELGNKVPQELLDLKWSFSESVDIGGCAILLDEPENVNVLFGPIESLEGEWSGRDPVLRFGNKFGDLTVKGVTTHKEFKDNYTVREGKLPSVHPRATFSIEPKEFPANELIAAGSTMSVSFPFYLKTYGKFQTESTVLNRKLHLFRVSPALYKEMAYYREQKTKIEKYEIERSVQRFNIVVVLATLFGMFLCVKHRGAYRRGEKWWEK